MGAPILIPSPGELPLRSRHATPSDGGAYQVFWRPRASRLSLRPMRRTVGGLLWLTRSPLLVLVVRRE
jgi:hypothetical protein